jgi:hypothetical protein
LGKESEKASGEESVRNLVRKNRLRSRVERNQLSSPILSPYSFIVAIVGKMVTRMSFASKGSERRE